MVLITPRWDGAATNLHLQNTMDVILFQYIFSHICNIYTIISYAESPFQLVYTKGELMQKEQKLHSFDKNSFFFIMSKSYGTRIKIR